MYALSGRLGFDYKSLYLFSNYFGSNKYQTLVLKAGRAYLPVVPVGRHGRQARPDRKDLPIA